MNTYAIILLIGYILAIVCNLGVALLAPEHKTYKYNPRKHAFINFVYACIGLFIFLGAIGIL